MKLFLALALVGAASAQFVRPSQIRTNQTTVAGGDVFYMFEGSLCNSGSLPCLPHLKCIVNGPPNDSSIGVCSCDAARFPSYPATSCASCHFLLHKSADCHTCTKPAETGSDYWPRTWSAALIGSGVTDSSAVQADSDLRFCGDCTQASSETTDTNVCAKKNDATDAFRAYGCRAGKECYCDSTCTTNQDCCNVVAEEKTVCDESTLCNSISNLLGEHCPDATNTYFRSAWVIKTRSCNVDDDGNLQTTSQLSDPREATLGGMDYKFACAGNTNSIVAQDDDGKYLTFEDGKVTAGTCYTKDNEGWIFVCDFPEKKS